MNKRYGLYDEDMVLIRIFMSKEEAEKFKTDGDVIMHLPCIEEPKLTRYEFALKKVGLAWL